ncbi:MAG: hypothetical protein ACFBZ8_01770 [Opitutales bacterium]
MIVLETRSTVWHDFQLETPADWELLQYTRDTAEGRLGWADRHHYRLEVGYRQVEGAPNLERFLSDYKVKLEVQEARKIKDTTAGGWPGISAHHDGRFTTRYFRYFEPLRYLIEIVFAWPKARDRPLETQILESAIARRPRYLPTKGDKTTPDHVTSEVSRRFQAFGLDLEIDAEWPLVETEVQPAVAKLIFAPETKDRAERRYERYGMVELWLEGSILDWLRQQLPAKAVVEQEEILHPSGHEVSLISGIVPRESLVSRFLKPFRMRAAAWRCPHDGRLYHVRSIAPTEPSSIHADSLSCCPAHRFIL